MSVHAHLLGCRCLSWRACMLRERIRVQTTPQLATQPAFATVLDAWDPVSCPALDNNACACGATQARRALTPLLVPHEDLPLSATLDAFGWSLMAALGASVGGLAVSWLGATTESLLQTAVCWTFWRHERLSDWLALSRITLVARCGIQTYGQLGCLPVSCGGATTPQPEDRKHLSALVGRSTKPPSTVAAMPEGVLFRPLPQAPAPASSSTRDRTW